MLIKLAFKNAAKSFKDYAIYFLTLTLGVCIFYMFNSIYAQQEIMSFKDSMDQSLLALQEILSVISVFVAIVLGFLIIYANNFFIKRRKKELGVYMTLGMSKRKISTILLLETSIIAVVALSMGLIIGIFGSQFMSLFTAKIFEADLSSYKFIFSFSAALKSAIYFGVIFVVVIVFNTITVGKVHLIDLLYGSKRNESLKIEKPAVSLILFILSILSLAAAYILIMKNGMVNINPVFWTSLILGTVGTILFFLSLSGLLVKLLQRNKNLYYRGLNMFTMRQLNSKVNTNFVSISVVCIVLLLVIGIFSCGYSLQNVLSSDLRESAPYDFTVVNLYEETVEDSIWDQLPAEWKNNQWIISHCEYKISVLEDGKSKYRDYDLSFTNKNIDFSDMNLYLTSISEYNNLRKLQGLPEYHLEEGKYLMVNRQETMKDLATQFITKNIELSIAGITLSPVSTIEDTVLKNDDFGTIVFVIDDSLIHQTKIIESYLNIQCKDEKSTKALDEVLFNYYINSSDNNIFTYYLSKTSIAQASITTKATVSFLAIYLGIVFMITCAAILAIQQLSEASDNKYRYTLLKKLGVSQKELNKALFQQILWYFVMPLSLAIVHSIVGLTVANQVIQMFGKIDITENLFATAVFVIGIYGVYFLVTYLGCRNIIMKETD